MSARKNILINASTVKISGGLYVALDLITAFVNSKNLNVRIISPDIRSFSTYISRAETIFVPRFFFHYLFRPLLDFWWLPRKIRQFNPDIVISLSNLPAVTNKFQVFFHDNAFMSMENLNNLFPSWKNRFIHQLRRIIFRQRLKYIDRIVTQTSLEEKKLKKNYAKCPPINVILPILPSHLSTQNIARFEFGNATAGYIRIGCLSRYFSHKNIEILYDTARLAAQHNLSVQFVLTIQKKQGKQAKKLLQKMTQEDFGHRIINVGKIPRDRISQFVQSVDALILPSLCETYGLNSLEAWFHGKYYLLSDLDFAHEVCEHAALFFDPANPENILACVELLLKKDESLSGLLIRGKEKINSLPKPEEVVENILNLIEK